MLQEKKLTDSNEYYAQLINETLSYLRFYKLSNQETTELNSIKQISNKAGEEEATIIKKLALNHSITEGYLVLGGLIILYIALSFLSLPLPKISVFLLIMLRMIPYVKQCHGLRQCLKALNPSLIKINDLVSKLKINTTIFSGDLHPQNKVHSIKFSSINFNYVGRTNTIQNISFDIKPNQITSLIGASGCGKTTVVDLICRLRVPLSGNIYINDINIKELSIEYLRNNIGVITQTPVLFNQSIRDNIVFGQKKHWRKRHHKGLRIMLCT